MPTDSPTKEPTDKPTFSPTSIPSNIPTEQPSREPTKTPSAEPTGAPTEEGASKKKPKGWPTPAPTHHSAKKWEMLHPDYKGGDGELLWNIYYGDFADDERFDSFREDQLWNAEGMISMTLFH